MKCYKCGRDLNPLYDNFCCRRIHFVEEQSRGKIIKETKNIKVKIEAITKIAKKHKKKKSVIKKEIREAVLKRDKYKCVDCGCKKNLHVHHIVHREHGGSDHMNNLITLCDLCHTEQHRGEQAYNMMIKNFWQYEEIS